MQKRNKLILNGDKDKKICKNPLNIQMKIGFKKPTTTTIMDTSDRWSKCKLKINANLS